MGKWMSKRRHQLQWIRDQIAVMAEKTYKSEKCEHVLKQAQEEEVDQECRSNPGFDLNDDLFGEPGKARTELIREQKRQERRRRWRNSEGKTNVEELSKSQQEDSTVDV